MKRYQVRNTQSGANRSLVAREVEQYEIQTRNAANPAWSTDGIGDPAANRFDSIDEAEKAIESLKALGDEWATSEYRVSKI